MSESSFSGSDLEKQPPSDSTGTEVEEISQNSDEENESEKVTPDNTLLTPKLAAAKKLASQNEAIDGGIGWLVVFSSFFQNLIVDGTLCSFGTILVYLKEDYNATNMQISWILSAQLSLQALFSPLASALIINFGTRAVMMMGAALMSAGTLVSAFVPNIYFLYITMGIVTGVGMSMLSQTASISISFYFNKKRGLANGISTTGSGLGFFIFPPLLTYLLEEFGLKGTCIILAGIMMQGIVCGALVIPLKHQLSNSDKAKMRNRQRIASLVQWARQQSTIVICAHADQSSIYSSNIHFVQAQYDLYNSSLGAATNGCGRFYNLLKLIAKASFDSKLLKDGAFMLYLLGTVLRQLVGYVPPMFIVSRAIDFGIAQESTGFLMSAYGVTNIVGRLLISFLADVSFVKPRRCYLYGLVSICAGAVTVVNFGSQLSHQMTFCAFYGLFYGCAISMKCTVLADVIGNQKLCTGFGMIMFAAGFTVFLGPSLAGWIYDATRSYDIVFGICGGIFIMSGVVVLPILYVLKYRKRVKEMKTSMTMTSLLKN